MGIFNTTFSRSSEGAASSDFIVGKTVANFAALPDPVVNDGLLAVAIASQGVWLVNYKAKGIYYSEGGAWLYQGDYELTDEASEISFSPSGGVSASNVQSAIVELDGDKVNVNGAITGDTKTKITYDSKGLVTSGADATTVDIVEAGDRFYVTSAELAAIGTIGTYNSWTPSGW